MTDETRGQLPQLRVIWVGSNSLSLGKRMVLRCFETLRAKNEHRFPDIQRFFK